MEIKKIKVYSVLKCSENDSVQQISKRMKDSKERRIFVVDGEGKIKGLITTTDLVYKTLCDDCNKKAKDVMTVDVKTVDISEDLEKALEIMNEIRSFVCPVTEKGKVLGIINYHDLVNYVFKEIEK